MNTVEHLVTHKYIVRNFPQGKKPPVFFRKGDTFIPTDNELRDFSDRLQPLAVRTIIRTVKAQIEEETGDPSKLSEVEKVFNPSDFNIKQLMIKVESGELDAQELIDIEVNSPDPTRETLITKLAALL